MIMRWPSKWLTRRRVFRCVLYGVATLAVLIALFYFEENWRGLRAWNHFKAQAEAKGERFDRSALTQSFVPDNENFAVTPIMVSGYASGIDKTGNRIFPPLTNVVDRLAMGLIREDAPPNFEIMDSFTGPTNLSDWRYSKFTDLGFWQHHFRDPPKIKYVRPPQIRYRSWGAGPNITPLSESSSSPPINRFPVAPHPQGPAADVLLALSRYDSAIEELRKATLLPNSRFPVHYDSEEPSKFIRNSGARLLRCAEVLDLRSVAELDLKNTSQALQDVLMGLRLAEVATNELLKWRSWDSGVINMMIQPIWEGVAKHQWSDSQLRTLDDELGKVDFLAQYAKQVREARTFALDEIEFLRKIHNKGIVSPSCVDDENFGSWLIDKFFRAFPEGWYYENELTAATAYQRMLTQLDLATRVASIDRKQDSFEAPEFGTVPLIHPCQILALLTRHDVPAIQYAYTQTSIDLARIACAAERYRISFGKYPKSLNLLVPPIYFPSAARLDERRGFAL
jgi:hypothetical protein